MVVPNGAVDTISSSSRLQDARQQPAASRPADQHDQVRPRFRPCPRQDRLDHRRERSPVRSSPRSPSARSASPMSPYPIVYVARPVAPRRRRPRPGRPPCSRPAAGPGRTQRTAGRRQKQDQVSSISSSSGADTVPVEHTAHASPPQDGFHSCATIPQPNQESPPHLRRLRHSRHPLLWLGHRGVRAPDKITLASGPGRRTWAHGHIEGVARASHQARQPACSSLMLAQDPVVSAPGGHDGHVNRRLTLEAARRSGQAPGSSNQHAQTPRGSTPATAAATRGKEHNHGPHTSQSGGPMLHTKDGPTQAISGADSSTAIPKNHWMAKNSQASRRKPAGERNDATLPACPWTAD